MGEEAFDESVLVANSGTVVVRGSYGRERAWLGLAKGRNDEPDLIVELTERQRRSIGVLLDAYVQSAAMNHAEALAVALGDALDRMTGVDGLADEPGFERCEEVLAEYREWVLATGRDPWCIRCGHAATGHLVDDEERRECAHCECEQYEAPQ